MVTVTVAPVDGLEIQLCGGLHVRRGSQEIDLSTTARLGRLALAYLALNRERTVTRDELMERLWHEPDPQRVAASLTQTLSRLRGSLGRSHLARMPGGNVRLIGTLVVDIEHAEAALRDGRSESQAGAWQPTLQTAAKVLVEIAGEVMAGDQAEWLEPVRRHVADLRIEALELRAMAALRLGAPEDAEADAWRVIEAVRTRETAWALLIEANAARGDIAGATSAFDECRRLLHDECGLPPSRWLIELHDRFVAEGRNAATAPPAPPAAERTVAFPPGLSIETGEGPFVGRDKALARLREAYARADQGTRQFALLCGEPGIGKTRLASEFAREAHASGAIVLYGRSDAETLVPYQPFTTALEHAIAQCHHLAFVRELTLELRELGRLIPGLRRYVPSLLDPLPVEPEMRRYRMFDAVSRVLSSIARDQPTVLVLDDLHWADTSTALLVRHIVQHLGSVRLLVLGTFRDVEACRSDDLAELLARLRPRSSFDQISLHGLDAAETAALVDARQGWEATHGFIRRLRHATDGNPLLIEETLRSLAESGVSGDTEPVSERTLSPIPVPDRLNAVIGRRLLHLSDAAREALAIASVIGPEFRVTLLAPLLERNTEQILLALEDAAAAGLVREVEDKPYHYAFSHALVREVLREEPSDSRRKLLHRRIGEALEGVGAPSPARPAELAQHFFESRELDGGGKALRYCMQAGDGAAASLAHEEAAEHYRRALIALAMQTPSDGLQHSEVLLALGRVELRQGDPAALCTFARAAELARRRGLSEQLGRAALGYASRYTEAGVVDEPGIALLEEALAAIGTEPNALRAELLARLAENVHFAPELGDTRAISHAALVMARHIGDPHALALALESRHAALLCVDHLDERLRLCQEMLELAELVGERELEALGRHWRIYDLLEAADVEAARAEHRSLVVLANELRQPLFEHFAVGWEVVWALMCGRLGDVERLAEEALELGERAQARDAGTIYRAQLIALRRRELRLPEFISIVHAAVEEHPAISSWRAVVPLAHLAAGEHQRAREEFEQFARDDFAGVRRDMFWFTSMCVLAETCALLQDTRRARVIYTMLIELKDRNVQVTQAACWGSVERFLGLLAVAMGRWNLAIKHYESAIAKNLAAGNLGSSSLVQRDYAEMLVARRCDGDLAHAVRLLREALQVAEEMQMSGLIAFIRARIGAIEAELDSPVPLAANPPP